MALLLTGTGSVFERLGKIFGLVSTVNTFRGTTIPPKVAALQAEFTSSDQDIIDGIYSSMSSYQSVQSTWLTYLKSLSSSVLVRMVNEDSPQSSSTSLPLAMKYLIAQMVAQSKTVQSCTVSASATAGGGNAGNGVCGVSVKRYDGLNLEDIFNETVSAAVSRDSYSGAAVSGRESLTFSAPYAVGDTLSWLYPAGSGATVGVSAIDGSQSSSGGVANFLNNSNFETWTVANVPDGWVIATGTAGTTVGQSATHYDGSYSLNFIGNGSELTAVTQQFGDSGGTAVGLSPSNALAFNAWVRVDSTPADGVLAFSLVDPSGTVINDSAGTANTVTKSLTSVSTTWVNVTGFFRTPAAVPAGSKLRIGLSTALTSGRNVYVDRVAMARPTALYTGGPLVAVFSGSTPFLLGDTFSAPVVNNYGGKFQYMFDQVFGMRAMGLLLPSSDSPNISDSLIS